MDDDESRFEPVGRKVRCVICGAKGYPNNPWQNRHRGDHPFRCRFCGRGLTTLVGRKNHERITHPGQEVRDG